MTFIALVGSLCLILLRGLKLLKISGSGLPLALLSWIAGILGGVFLVHQGLEHLGLMPATPLNEAIKYNINVACRAVAGDVKNIVFIEGGSNASRGIDIDLLEQNLEHGGLSAAIINFNKAGANHFERYWMLKEFFRLIPEDQRRGLLNRNVIFLREVCWRYDIDPLAQFNQNFYKDRGLSYLQPAIALEALLAIRAFHRKNKTEPDKITVRELINHGLLNLFHIGFAQRFASFKKVPVVKDRSLLDQPNATFHYDGIKALLDYGKCERVLAGPDIEWKFTMMDELLKGCFGREVKNVFFAMPTITGENLCHLVNQYKKKYPLQDLLNCAEDMAMIRKLDGPGLWHDDIHLTAPGARLYTEWCSRKLIESGLFVK